MKHAPKTQERQEECEEVYKFSAWLGTNSGWMSQLRQHLLWIKGIASHSELPDVLGYVASCLGMTGHNLVVMQFQSRGCFLVRPEDFSGHNLRRFHVCGLKSFAVLGTLHS